MKRWMCHLGQLLHSEMQGKRTWLSSPTPIKLHDSLGELKKRRQTLNKTPKGSVSIKHGLIA